MDKVRPPSMSLSSGRGREPDKAGLGLAGDPRFARVSRWVVGSFRLNGARILPAGLSIESAAARKMLYDGLADRFQRIKAAIKGQNGTASTQWEEVKGMKW